MPLLPDLVETYGTPFHIYDEAGILANHRMICAAFADHPMRQYFAVKALPNPAVLEALVAQGSGLDCSSPHELTMAAKAGARGEAIVFTSNNTTACEYEAALAAGAVITFDDVLHMRRAPVLPEIVAFRIAPHGLAARSSLMGNAGQSKFGVPVPQLAAAYREARERGATRFGIHGMICANELDPANAERAGRDLVDIAAGIEAETGIRFDYVNFGGGLGIPYTPDDPATRLRSLCPLPARRGRGGFSRSPPAHPARAWALRIRALWRARRAGHQPYGQGAPCGGARCVHVRLDAPRILPHRLSPHHAALRAGGARILRPISSGRFAKTSIASRWIAAFPIPARAIS